MHHIDWLLICTYLLIYTLNIIINVEIESTFSVTYVSSIVRYETTPINVVTETSVLRIHFSAPISINRYLFNWHTKLLFYVWWRKAVYWGFTSRSHIIGSLSIDTSRTGDTFCPSNCFHNYLLWHCIPIDSSQWSNVLLNNFHNDFTLESWSFRHKRITLLRIMDVSEKQHETF